MDLAKVMGCSIITTHIGVIPDEDNTKRKILHEACEKIGRYGEGIGVKLAIETGPETCMTLKSFLEGLRTKNVGVNFDPANLAMVTGDDPVNGVFILKDYIFHTHAKDGIMKKQTEPRIIYDYFAQGGIENMRLEDYFIETPLGEGAVNFKKWVEALKNINYSGYLTIERETSDTPYIDIEKAVKFLEKIIN
jgi:sugar phosphate isomerase/epimerase